MKDWEENLPPIVREKLARAGQLAPEEKAKLKDLDLLNALLTKFHKGELNSQGLCSELKDYRDKGKGYLLKEAQMKLVDSLSPGSPVAELQKRTETILALETLKKERNTSALEQSLNLLESLQKRHGDELVKVYNNLKAQVERNPQLRMRQVNQGQGTKVIQLTMDEAVRTSPEWNNFEAEHEKRYTQEFAKVILKLKKEIR